MEEKEDPDDVIYDTDGIHIVTIKSEFISLKENYKNALLHTIKDFASYVETVTEMNKNTKKIIQMYKLKINIYTKLYYIADNYQDFEDYIHTAYKNMCDASRTDSVRSLGRINNSLNKILSKKKMD